MSHGQIYWTLQVVAWSAYGAFNLALISAFGTVTSGMVLICVALAAGLLAASHATRLLMKRRAWLNLAPTSLSWRLGPAVALAALAVQVLIGLACGVGLTLDWIEMSADGPPYTPKTFALYWFNTALILALWCLAYVGYVWFQRWRLGQIEHWRTETALREAELSLLKAQLDPHFLFNALNNIRATITEDPARAREMVTRLSQVLRHVLTHTRRDRVTLREELDAVRDYLVIVGLHFEERLTVRESIDAGTLDAQVPPLLLQLLVENAIKHGVARHDRGALEIRIASAGDSVQIEVFNEGELAHSAGGVGLANLSQRLARGIGQQARITLEQIGGRVRAAVSVPR